MSMPEPEMVTTRHSLTGAIQRVTPDQVSVFPEFLEVVPDDAKPYEPGMFKPGMVGEFKPSDLPETASVDEARRVYEDLLSEGNAPNSRVVRDAKKRLDEMVENAEAEREAAEALVAEAEAERQAAAQNPEGTEPTTSAEGDAQ